MSADPREVEIRREAALEALLRASRLTSRVGQSLNIEGELPQPLVEDTRTAIAEANSAVQAYKQATRGGSQWSGE